MMYLINEGAFPALPGFEDKSIQVLCSKIDGHDVSLTVSRDIMACDDTLDSYVDKQLGQLKRQFPGYKLTERRLQPRVVDGRPPFDGVVLESRYSHKKEQVFQRQYGINLSGSQMLIFTLTSHIAFTPAMDGYWQSLLDGFQPSTLTTIEG